MADPALSIVIPTLDEAATISALLDDLQSWRQRGDELILVDGGSSDGTPDIAAPKVDRVLTTRAGRALQMNAGADASRGGILWFLHADSRVASGLRDALLAPFAAGRVWGRFDVRLSGRQPMLRVIERAMNLRSCLTGIATGDQGICVTRNLFHAVGGYPDIGLMEDIALSRRLRRAARPACIGRPCLQTSSRRWEQRGILSTMLLMWRLRLAYWQGADPDRLAREYRT